MNKLITFLLLILIGCSSSAPTVASHPSYYYYIDEETGETTKYINHKDISGKLDLYSGTETVYVGQESCINKFENPCKLSQYAPDDHGNIFSQKSYKDGKPHGVWIETIQAITYASDPSSLQDDVEYFYYEKFRTTYEEGREIETVLITIMGRINNGVLVDGEKTTTRSIRSDIGGDYVRSKQKLLKKIQDADIGNWTVSSIKEPYFVKTID